MTQIRPVSDLRNKFTEISREVRENNGGVILTQNGYADMVVMSYDAYNRRKFEEEIYLKLMEAEMEALTNPERLSHEEVFGALREKYALKADSKDV